MMRNLQQLSESQEGDLNTMFILVSGFIVFFMQCGFCMLSAGSVKRTNAKNIILKNLLDACIGALAWYLFGYAFTYGSESNSFIGYKNFAMKDVPLSDYGFWFFQYAFAATAATIVSGAVAERTKFQAYLMYAFVLTAWVYPVVAHWVWQSGGWLSAFPKDGDTKDDLYLKSGLIDFAGCGVVHMVGGLSGLIGAWAVGARDGKFVDGKPVYQVGHNASLALLGVFILWFGWYGFNPGSALAIIGASDTVALCAVTTTLSAASGTVTTLAISTIKNYMETKKVVWDLLDAGNGSLAGLVAITAGCSVVHPWAAIVAGAIGSVVYLASSCFVLNVLKVDDPLDAAAVHGFTGMWGLLVPALFASKDLMNVSYGDIDGVTREYGLFYGGSGRLLSVALIAIVVITAWVAVHMTPFFYVLKYFGLLRVKPEHEKVGLDLSHHGGSAYSRDNEMNIKSLFEEIEKINLKLEQV